MLKVFGEDLAHGPLNAVSVAGGKPMDVSATQGALCVYVCAEGKTVINSPVEVVFSISDTEIGEFTEIDYKTLNATQYFEDGDVMLTYTIPCDLKKYLAATVNSSESNTGAVRVTLGYLAR